MLILLAQLQEIGLWYGDESGFSLTPTVPYGWSKKGQQVGILSQRSARLNVLGFLSTDNELISYPHMGSVNSDFVIECLDNFVQEIVERRTDKQPQVMVLDNAPMHRSEAFQAKLPDWQAQGIHIFFLPRYSPHLNRIERLWKQIKGSWLKPENYLGLDHLKQAITNILEGFGTEFVMNFDNQAELEKLILKSG